jgi:hypothetical protein
MPRGSLLVIILVGLVGLLGCSDAMVQKLRSKAVALGTINQLTVISDADIWEGEIGDSIQFYFGSAFPILPQPEPLFDLRHYSPEDLLGEPLRKELKAYLLIANVSDMSSPTREFLVKEIGEETVLKAMNESTPTNSVRYDLWAEGQILVFLFANDNGDLLEEIIQRFPAIAQRIEEYYTPQIDASVYLGGQNGKIIQTIRDSLGLELKVPGDYILAYSTENTTWIRKETDVLSSNIIMHRLKYRSEEQFSKASIISLRDSLGKQLVRTDIPGSFMVTNDVDLPVFLQQVNLAETYTVEIRGIWEIEGDFMGGPFISYLLLDENEGELVFIDCFVHAPGEDKRNFMLHLEHIISSISL